MVPSSTTDLRLNIRAAMSVKIAIIDSGVNASHFHVRHVEQGWTFRFDKGQNVVKENGCADEIGHGTAIAGVIRERLPSASLYALKIFQQTLNAPYPLLHSALDWAVKTRAGIIHLSLGTRQSEHRKSLEDLCRRAYRKKIIIVAATQSPREQIFPSTFDTVIGVYGHPECGPDDLICHPSNTSLFGAHGRPRPLPGLPQEANFSGSSFAAARVTALVAEWLSTRPQAAFADIIQLLHRKGVKSALDSY